MNFFIQTFFKIKLPIAIKQSLPAYGNEMILMLKGTSLASTVTLLDLTGVAKHIISTTFRPVEVFIVAGSIYLLMTFIIHNFIKFLEKKYNYNFLVGETLSRLFVIGPFVFMGYPPHGPIPIVHPNKL